MSIVSHIGLCVSDLERSTRFYCEGLGFTYDRDLAMSGADTSDFLGLPAKADLKAVYLLRGPFQLELLQFQPAGPTRQKMRVMTEPGLTHISIAVADIATTVAAALRHGGTLMSSLGDDIAAMIRDPDGQMIELITIDWLEAIESARAKRDNSMD